ncbi:hypothetical protein KSP40_PGU011278 [Platanthera guangdongensis]|uniref:RNA-binding protein NOB1 n=1 Tax=Platanthera guangdongensis TaxID=2320717 RepID=A0ABR2M8B2_9ASPA
MDAATPLPPPNFTLQPPPASLWSAIVQKNLTPVPPAQNCVFVDSISRKGISVAVVDSSAIIHGDKITGLADRFVSVREVVEEIRDPVSRQRITRLPFLVEIMEPSSDAIKKVVKFAKETGDLHTLSDVDLKLIALTYMLESQIHGTNHLRTKPPLLQTINVKNLPEIPLPGWGDNVPNLAEWEALDQVTDGDLMAHSKILPLKDLDDNVIPTKTEAISEPADDHHLIYRHKKIYFPKREIKIEGKKMVSDGVDASNGENVDDIDDWHPAVSRSTHRRYLRRKARRELRVEDKGNDHLVEDASPITHKSDESFSENSEIFVDSANHEVSKDANFEDELDTNDVMEAINFVGSSVSSIFDQMALDNNILADDDSLMMRSLSDSTVACITSDYAMQNVILQIGLRLLASGGMQIHQLHRWVLKCHACNNVTQEIGKIFCPKCGNGGTLRKVSVTVGENDILLASRRQRIILRGTKFSLPLPQGGRDAITKNLILREDQLPHRLLYPKLKKKSNKDEFLGVEDIFSHAGEKRAPLKPPVRKALAMFSGKRNPNDNHFSRKH